VLLPCAAACCAAPAACAHSGTVEVSAAGVPAKTLALAITCSGTVESHGDADVYTMTRLRWLDSTLGVDESVKPFTNLTVGKPRAAEAAAGGAFTITAVNKQTVIGKSGLPPAPVVDCDGGRRSTRVCACEKTPRREKTTIFGKFPTFCVPKCGQMSPFLGL